MATFNRTFCTFVLIVIVQLIVCGVSRHLHKRSFLGLGCYGNNDKSKFARLDRVCEECYMLFRKTELHTKCKLDCFRNDVFTKCVDALLLTHEQKKFEEMANDLFGR